MTCIGSALSPRWIECFWHVVERRKKIIKMLTGFHIGNRWYLIKPFSDLPTFDTQIACKWIHFHSVDIYCIFRWGKSIIAVSRQSNIFHFKLMDAHSLISRLINFATMLIRSTAGLTSGVYVACRRTQFCGHWYNRKQDWHHCGHLPTLHSHFQLTAYQMAARSLAYFSVTLIWHPTNFTT